ncbi:flagellar basal-body rod protein FlgC [Thermanaerovibrio velox DSM 12556]|jgi:flagellar basal-body rod protein FlgC|uniref:Flagellar basal-body rod protein FlgC n=1 Tax=Thermanaerovibrio velox DSM 12556 TaxID=926567 RepID=H0UPN9_9BACT|nr:flagellar basal body rod protein FlgC [Thermanaerovibrio velox]EHM09586.1 flagellar basal-body rod protein FlgC [Thermanaerovibrio velox DSM 12556]
MRVFRSVDVAGSALTAHRVWMDAISSNLANANTTRTPEGGPYVRRVPVFQERLMEALKDGSTASGVKVVSLEKDPLPPRMVYQPDHPDANQEGYVAYPNVNVVREMADMMVASRAYEANLTVVETGKAMWNSALEIMRG